MIGASRASRRFPAARLHNGCDVNIQRREILPDALVQVVG
jgi:hypothetical protein